MQEKSIETITDRNSFQELFNNFSGKQSFIKTRELNIKAEFVDYSDGQAAFKIPNVKSMPDKCVIFIRNKTGSTIYAFLKLIENKQGNIFIFLPIKIQIVFLKRKEERKTFGCEGGEKQILYICNIMSDFMIKEDLALNNKRVKSINENIKIKLGKIFQRVKIFFIHEGIDARMKYFNEGIRPLFISNLKNKPDEKHIDMFNYYLKEIYPQDIFLNKNKHFISEISVPILFRGRIPYGFIQINQTSSFQESSISIIKKTAVAIEEILQKHGIFTENEEKLLVSDLSKTGIGIVFKDKRYFRFFKEDSLVYFDLLLPDNKKANILSIVRNITGMGGSTFKVGCEVKDIDALSEVYYDEFLESVGLPVN